MSLSPQRELSSAGLRDTSYLQRHLWHAGQQPQPSQVRALRLAGELDHDRLMAAIGEVTAALEVLRVEFREHDGTPVMTPATTAPYVRLTRVDGPAQQRDDRAVAVLLQDRDRGVDPGSDPLVRFHVLDLGAGETVLGLVAHPLVLDLHSIYLVLGAVMLAYFGRFRVEQYPPFAGCAGTDPVGPDTLRRSRSAWWSRLLAESHRPGEWRRPMPASGQPAAQQPQTLELLLGDDRWQRLSGLSGSGGNSGSLALIALLAWWLRHRAPDAGRPILGSTLDLRDYLGLGTVIGPLTDRVVFAVDLGGFDGMSFRDLVLRSHAGLLDAVVHYLPYGELVALGVERGVWDIAVNYCRLPPASSYTRGEQTLASRGLSIELFSEAGMVRAALAGTSHGPNIDLHVAESATGMSLVVNFDAGAVGRGTVDGMLHDIGEVIDRVINNPDLPVRALGKETR